MRTATQLVVPSASIKRRIHTVRGQRVMLDSDLAALYGVTTGAPNQAVRRNPERFPDDFMFVLALEEAKNLKSQTVISSWGGRRKPPSVFTEHGVAMLSTVLSSERAVEVSIMIVRSFIRMRELMAANKDIAARVDNLERSHKRAALVIETLVDDIDRIDGDVRQLKAPTPSLAPSAPKKRKIGFGA